MIKTPRVFVPFQFTWFLNLTFNFLGFSRFSLSPLSKIAYECHVCNFTMLHTTHAYMSVLACVFHPQLKVACVATSNPEVARAATPNKWGGSMSYPSVGGSLMSQPLCRGWSCEHPLHLDRLCEPPLSLGAAKQAVPFVGGGCGIHRFTSV